MKLAQLQGTPWHFEKRQKTCGDGSKYCIYNHKICSCVANEKYYHKHCVGKGSCEWFEPRTGTPKIYASKTYKTKNNKEAIKMNKNTQTTKESKEQKFLRISETRINKIEESIKNLENLSDKNTYSYTEQQVDKMFLYLEEKLESAKQRFKNNNSGGFQW